MRTNLVILGVIGGFTGLFCAPTFAKMPTPAPSPSPVAADWPSVQTLVQGKYAPLVTLFPWLGVSIGVVRGSEVQFYSYGNGVAGKPATEDTIFTINSMTKALDGTILAQEVIENKVALTDPVQKFLPDHVIPQTADRQIELVDLATHTSGLPTIPANLIQPDTLDPYRGYTDELFFSFLAGYQIGAIGTQYVYSNLGFGLLGYTLSQLDGTSFEKMVEQRIVEPFGLVETSADESFAPPLLALAVGHDQDGNVQGPRGGPETMAGSWAVHSTTADVVRILQAYLSPDRTTPLGRSLDLAQTSTGRATDPGFTSALGWFVQESSGIRYKDGGGGGFSSVMFFNRATQTALVVLSNVEDGDVFGIEQRAWDIMNAVR